LILAGNRRDESGALEDSRNAGESSKTERLTVLGTDIRALSDAVAPTSRAASCVDPGGGGTHVRTRDPKQPWAQASCHRARRRPEGNESATRSSDVRRGRLRPRQPRCRDDGSETVIPSSVPRSSSTRSRIHHLYSVGDRRDHRRHEAEGESSPHRGELRAERSRFPAQKPTTQSRSTSSSGRNGISMATSADGEDHRRQRARVDRASSAGFYERPRLAPEARDSPAPDRLRGVPIPDARTPGPTARLTTRFAARADAS